MVRPEDAREPLGKACAKACSAVPLDCLPVTRKWKKNISAALPAPITIRDATHHSVAFDRTTIPLGAGYAVTDYFAQGMSFKEEYWLAHLTPPPGRARLQRSSVYVSLTRFARMSKFLALAPLWTEDDASARDDVISKFHDAAQVDPELVADVKRLEALSVETLQRYQPLIQRLGLEAPLPITEHRAQLPSRTRAASAPPVAAAAAAAAATTTSAAAPGARGSTTGTRTPAAAMATTRRGAGNGAVLVGRAPREQAPQRPEQEEPMDIYEHNEQEEGLEDEERRRRVRLGKRPATMQPQQNSSSDGSAVNGNDIVDTGFMAAARRTARRYY